MLDNDLWIPLFALMGLALVIKFAWRPKKRKILRISPASVQASRKVAIEVLPLVEGDADHPMDERLLPYPKDRIKSALKILIYQFAHTKQSGELERVKNCYVGLARFQDLEMLGENAVKVCASERERLSADIHRYLMNAPRG
ncbi:hypothetical protein [Salidesulfovibrio brasiliensis]|uniref:hypothetical protein n=1 Tax=Salidesulfovibrio brasiliensis TaxID=221711 RepID=UPI0006D180F9|nr:hypothetical protein [Salidesulfovibrio brasiliensis]